MLDFRYYRNFSRTLFKINLCLAVLFCISLIFSYSLLIKNPKMRYYIQTNNGFIFPVDTANPNGLNNAIIITHFE